MSKRFLAFLTIVKMGCEDAFGKYLKTDKRTYRRY